MKLVDYVTAAVMLILAVVVVIGTRELDVWDDFGPSSRFMPVWVAGAAAILALLLVLEANRRTEEPDIDWPDRSGVRRVALTFAGIVAFVAAAPLLGFVLATAIFVLGLLLGIDRRPLLPSALAALVTAALIQAIFVSWLSIALPKGVFGL